MNEHPQSNKLNSSTPEIILTAALDYLSRGWSVFPLPYREKVSRRFKWKAYQTERADERELRGWFGSESKNLAIVCGDISGGLVVRDFDTAAAYRQWESEHRDLAASLPTVATTRGFHVYARVNPCPRTLTFHDGELRANGGYVVAVPSIHPEGVRYRWVIPFQGDAYLPLVALANLAVPHTRTEEGQKRDRRGTEEGQKETDSRLIQKQTDTEAVWEEDWWEPITIAVSRSIPSGEEKRNACILKLARRLLTITNGQKMPTARRLQVFDLWWRDALPMISTKEKSVSMHDFLKACKDAHTPLDDKFYVALDAAKRNPTPSWADAFEEPVRLLAGLCRELQRLERRSVFYLSCRKAQKAIGFRDYRIAADKLNLFVLLEMLQVVEKGRMALASRYRYIADDL